MFPDKISACDMGLRAKEWRLVGGEFIESGDCCAFLQYEPEENLLLCGGRRYVLIGSEYVDYDAKVHVTEDLDWDGPCPYSDDVCVLATECSWADKCWGLEDR